MKAHLLYRDRDLDLEAPPVPQHEDLIQDLGLQKVFSAMAEGDDFLADIARRVLLSSLEEPDAIRYRQAVLRDCLENFDLVRSMYDLTVEAIKGERQAFIGLFSRSPGTILYRSVQVMELFTRALERLRQMASEGSGKVRSEGMRNLFQMLVRELDDRYLEAVSAHLKQLRFDAGVLIGARLGEGLKGTDLVLRRPHRQRWRDRLPGSPRLSYSFRVPDRDEAGLRALSQLRDRGLNEVANALAQSCDHVLSFFRMLRVELGFYVGCVNLHRRLAAKGEPTCFPDPTRCCPRVLTCRGLYDVSLSLDLEERVVGNDVSADSIPLIMVTGANQGGKSTFLRSLGLAQLMMQAGMFVGALSFRANVASSVHTHFKRREDASMRSGKLDEELSRMSTIADRIRPGGLLLCNESFASTNEAEGSEIARQVIGAMLDSGVRVVCVTHMFDLADGFRGGEPGRTLFLRAERKPDGQRTFRMIEGEPLPTSFGEDLYRRILGRGAPCSSPGTSPGA